MSKKTVIRADLVGSKCKSEILSTVAKLEGIKSVDIDPDKCTLTVVGTVDPVRIVHKLKKACFAAAIVSVVDDKPKKKDPCQEACEKACKEACEKACKGACEKGRYYCMPGCSYYNPCALPNCNYKSACTPVRYGCYEERSPGGECTIQ